MEGSGEKRGYVPQIKVVRRNSAGRDVPMEVGIQGALLEDTDPKFQVKGKEITPVEQQVADVAAFGRIRPETEVAARRQRKAISNRIKKDGGK